jgi:hypothetical protein
LGALIADPMKYKKKKWNSDLSLQEDDEQGNTFEPILEKI